LIGQILSNRYRILREIGSGGMAKVFLAEDMNEGQVAAVKVLYSHFGEDISYIQRFTREAKLASSLNSPHIVKILDYGASRDTHYLVMEYVEGQDLRETLNNRGPLPWQEALQVIDQVCQALEEANAHSIIHRDIKPQNIMIADSGLVKVLDFGIARSRSLPSLTQSGFVGSPYYISPEQAMGEEVDIRSDIYSTGIVLYELLSGRVPFDAQSPWSIISKHIASEPPEIALEDGSVSEPAQKLLKRMVAKNPDDRFQDPSALRRAIKAVLQGHDLPLDLGTPPPPNTDKAVMADSLYRRAEDAMAEAQWQKAVSLLNQVIDLNPGHPQAFEKRSEAGTQARLTALYSAASRAMEAGRWQEAVDELTEILEIDADYNDSVKLLVQAREAAEKQSADLELSNLYEQAMAHFEAEEYEAAEALFDRIRKISPVYRRADALWAESRRRKTSQGGFERLNQELVQKTASQPKVTVNKTPLKWAAITIIAVVIIVGGIWGVSLNSAPPEVGTPSDKLLVQAQDAYESGNRALAASLVKQILSTEPDHQNALALQDNLDQDAQLNETLSDAAAAVAAKDWTTAIELLEALYAVSDFEPEQVAALLCDSHLSRGRERLASISSPRDQATVRAALAGFQAAQQVCPARPDIDRQVTFATGYLAALDDTVSPDEKIDDLQPIIRAEPGYAGGQAAQNLYQTYLERGDTLQQRGDVEAALADYDAALNLQVEDLSDAQRKQAQALQNLTVQPTATPPQTDQASSTNTPTPEQNPSIEVTPTTGEPAATGFEYGAPILLAPDSHANYAGQFAEIRLAWEAISLAPDEYYDVTVRYFVGTEPRYWGAPVTEAQWRVPVEAGYGQAGRDEFSWWVTIRRVGTHEPLSPPSDERIFFWRPG
jgi:serine/threonine protein kinase